MIRCLAALCCERVIVDQNDHSVSLISIQEGYAFHAFPFGIAQLAAFFFLQRDMSDSDEVSASIEFALDEQTVFSQEVVSHFAGRRHVRLVLNIHGLVVVRPGVLAARLRLGDEVIGKWEMPVEAIAPPAEPQVTKISG